MTPDPFPDPPVTRSCGNCVHGEPTVVDDTVAIQCRRYPPTVVVVDLDEDGLRSAWPHMEPEDWCSEHAPKLNVNPED